MGLNRKNGREYSKIISRVWMEQNIKSPTIGYNKF
jgi:hypothetical protein